MFKTGFVEPQKNTYFFRRKVKSVCKIFTKIRQQKFQVLEQELKCFRGVPAIKDGSGYWV